MPTFSRSEKEEFKITYRSGWTCDEQEKWGQGRELFEPQASLRGRPFFLLITGRPQRGDVDSRVAILLLTFLWR